MFLKDYQKDALRTAIGRCHDLGYAVMGIADEATEVIGPVKQYLYQGHELDRDAVIEELGDVLWYITLTAHMIGSDLSEVMERNVEKRRKRYPNGFCEQDSIHRNI